MHDRISPFDAIYLLDCFIDTEYLNSITPRENVYTSFLYQTIIDVPGVTDIRKLSSIN